MNVGDHVRKRTGFKFIGTILAIYSYSGTDYAVVACDPDQSQAGLQHIYKLDQLERVINPA